MELNFVCFERCFRRGVWGGVGPITFTCTYTHTWCYAARDIFSCTYTHTSYYARDIFFYARDIFSCTYTHTSCYARDMFLLLHMHTYFLCRYIHLFLHISTYLMLLPHRHLFLHILTYFMLRYNMFLLHIHTSSCYARDILSHGGKTIALTEALPCKTQWNVTMVFKIPGIFKVQFLTWNDYGAVAPSTFDSKTWTTASAVVTPPGCLCLLGFTETIPTSFKMLVRFALLNSNKTKTL